MKSIIGLSLVVLLAGLAPAQSVSVPDNYGAVYPVPNPVSPVIQAPVLDPSELPVGLGSDHQTDGPILLPFPKEPSRSVSDPGVVNPDDPGKGTLYAAVQPPALNPPRKTDDIRRGRSKYSFVRPGMINHDDLSIDVPPQRSKYSFARPGVINSDDLSIDVPPEVNKYSIARPGVINHDDLSIDVPPRRSKYSFARPGVINHDELSIDVPPRRSKYSSVRPGVVNPDDKAIDVPPQRSKYSFAQPGQTLDVHPLSPLFRDRIGLAFGPSVVGKAVSAELYDASGRQVLRSELNAASTSVVAAPELGRLSAGTYILKTYCGDCGPNNAAVRITKPLD